MKWAMTILLILGLVSFATAADLKPAFRLWGGFDRTWYSEEPAYFTFPEYGYVFGKKTGISFGAGLELPVPASVLSLIAEINYLQKGQKEFLYYWDELIGEAVYELDILSQVGLIKVKPAKIIPLFALIGYEVSAVLRHHYGGQAITSDTRKIDFGLVAGAGIEARIKDLEIFFEGRYYGGIINLSKQTGFLSDYREFNTRVLVFCFGLKFSPF